MGYDREDYGYWEIEPSPSSTNILARKSNMTVKETFGDPYYLTVYLIGLVTFILLVILQ